MENVRRESHKPAKGSIGGRLRFPAGFEEGGETSRTGGSTAFAFPFPSPSSSPSLSIISSCSSSSFSRSASSRNASWYFSRSSIFSVCFAGTWMTGVGALPSPSPLPLPPSSLWVVPEGPETVVGVVSFAWEMAFLMKRVAAALSIASWPVWGHPLVDRY